MPALTDLFAQRWAWLVGVAAAGMLASPAFANPGPKPWTEHRKLASRLAQWWAIAAQDRAAGRTWAQDAGVKVDAAGRALAELRLKVSPQGSPQVLKRLQRAGAEMTAIGSDRVDAQVAPEAMAAILADPDVEWVAPPLAPMALSQASAGARAIDAHVFHCATQGGEGIHVAVVDHNFDLWAVAVAAGTLPHTKGTPPNSGDMHGTACAEIVASVAPAATIVPVSVNSVASLQAWAAQELPTSAIAVVHHAMAWFGESFGSGTGALCKLVANVASGGRVWVQAAGNLAAGQVWHDVWRDDNKDGWLEFAPGTADNTLDAPGGNTVQVVLDWNAYPTTATDLDLYLCRVLPGDCSPVAASTSIQDGAQPPVEAVTAKLDAAGTYAVRVKHKAGPVPGLVRVQLPMAPAPLAIFRVDRTLADPATCDGSLSVAAIDVSQYAAGQVDQTSSRGPTFDLRPKPDIGAPSGVLTSVTDIFFGTSAAAAHVSGALALWMAKTGLPAPAAAQQLLAMALPRPGAAKPDYESGAGRLQLPAGQAGVACYPGAVIACALACGTSSTTVCSEACTPGGCLVPEEICDDLDQDCDGKTDEGFACRQGEKGTCTTDCGSAGTRTCSVKCAWPACAPPAETCNGKDDDCDGQTDDGFACAPGATKACTVHGLEGTQTCSDACGWNSCSADEVCNGKDDNGDGAVDEGVPCGAADDGCAARARGGRGWCALLLVAWGVVRAGRGSGCRAGRTGWFLRVARPQDLSPCTLAAETNAISRI